ncbi:Rv3654c family TadE-like protein [Corynebacterium striatum]|uniref:Rv3654c family TadE-like protein n=1 Tax=Corynebacterium striatum TaxID=43770 RepID=UPI0034D59D17|nr:flp pilus-assembly TadE/G-like family protein [Corynebacterium striatum]
MNRWRNSDAGYATVVNAGIIVAIVSLLLGVTAVAGRVAARHEAQVAADMAAVAAAWDHARGRDACAQARETAAHNESTLRECRVVERDVIVTVAVRRVEAVARAGPV